MSWTDFIADLESFCNATELKDAADILDGERSATKTEALVMIKAALEAASDALRAEVMDAILSEIYAETLRRWSAELFGKALRKDDAIENLIRRYLGRNHKSHAQGRDRSQASVSERQDQTTASIERGRVHALPDPARSPAVPAAYDHQLVALRRLEQASRLVPPVSGIVHLPTGAGKTRVALEYAARTLAAEPDHRFVWATNAKLLIEQTMSKAREYAALFPAGTRMAWYAGDPKLLDHEHVHLLFFTAAQLRDQLELASQEEHAHPWRQRVFDGKPLTLIYDESHQLGGEMLQTWLSLFHDDVVRLARQHRWRVIGLSATPVPTRLEAQELLREVIFPLRPHVESASTEWGMHVFHRADNKELIRDGVLCEVNMHWDRSGVFDIPPEMLKRVSGEARLRPPGPNARKDEVLEYAMKFDRDVMGNSAVVRFLSEKLARNMDGLGKTVVFVPSIAVANELVAQLNAYPACRGRVAAVHSQMADFKLAVPGQQERTPAEVIDKFRGMKSKPCILVNVDMLTEGFDDPLVRTVVLARLTLSTNRFWQMIGRGTRGPRANGTTDCFVIDPIKLTRLYDYFRGYQPSVTSRPGTAIDDEPEEMGPGALNPSVPVVSRPPLPSTVRYQVSDDLRRTHADAARAIEEFLLGGQLGEQEALSIAHTVRIAAEDGAVVVRPTSQAEAETGPVLLFEMFERIKTRLQNDLPWLAKQLPSGVSDDALRFWVRKLTAIEKLNLRTEEEYARAEMDGRLARELAIPVLMSPPAAQSSASAVVPEVDRTAEDVARVCAAITAADGEIKDAEVEVSLRLVRQLTGAIANEQLKALVTMPTDAAELSKSVARLKTSLDDEKRKALLWGLLDIAAADSFVHPAETRIVRETAANLGFPPAYVDALQSYHATADPAR